VKDLIETGEKNAFNGASIVTPAGRLLIHRRGNDHPSGLRYLWLDREGGGSSLPEMSGWGDPRLMWHHGKLLAFNNYVPADGGDKMEMHELLFRGRIVTTRRIARFDSVRGLQLDHQEKNWCPLSFEGRLYVEYSINPRVILLYDADTAALEVAFSSARADLPSLVAGAGPPRLSTPAVLLSGGGPKESFLSVFHVVVVGGDYYSAFYQFSARPPFEVVAMSAEPILWPEDAEGIAWRNRGFRVLYIQSLEVSEPEDRVVLFGGDNDQACVRIEMSLAEILQGLRPVGENCATGNLAGGGRSGTV